MAETDGITKGITMDHQDVYSILNLFGEQVPPDSHLTLLGGSALILLGNSRETIDIDFVGDDINPSDLHRLIIQIAKENKILSSAGWERRLAQNTPKRTRLGGVQ